MRINRRSFLSGVGGGLTTAAIPNFAFGRALAEMSVGNMKVQTLSDGYLTLPRDFLFPHTAPQDLEPIFAAHGLPSGALEPAINVTLMREGERVILFDTGAGTGFQETAGLLPEALDAIGIAPDDVTHVVFTHCHPDHLWGVLDDFDDPLFANAEFMMGQVEWDYWYDPKTASTIAGERATMAVGAKRRMDIIEERVTLFKEGEEILPGVEARGTFGHTPGHMSYVLRSETESVIVIGDAIGNHHVSFSKPDWHVGTDQEPEQAAQTRASLLDYLVADDVTLIGYHLPGGGIGRAERHGEGYRFVASE